MTRRRSCLWRLDKWREYLQNCLLALSFARCVLASFRLRPCLPRVHAWKYMGSMSLGMLLHGMPHERELTCLFDIPLPSIASDSAKGNTIQKLPTLCRSQYPAGGHTLLFFGLTWYTFVRLCCLPHML